MVEYIEHAIPKCETIDIEGFSVRYLLDIELTNNHGGSALCIMMNPSRADMAESDDTINKVVEFFNDRNYKAIKIFNLFPFYVTSSSDLRQVIDDFQTEADTDNFREVMNRNFSIISEITNKIDKDVCVVLAWGDPPTNFENSLYQRYIDKALGCIENLPNINIFESNYHSGNITKLGNPRHPSRITLTGLLKIKTVKYRHILMNNDEDNNTSYLTDGD